MYNQTMDLSHLVSRTENHRAFHTFCLYPKATFESQEDDEEVVLIVRAHPVTQIPWILNAGFLILIPILLNLLLPFLLSIKEIIFVNLFWYATVASYIFVSILKWIFNVGIITNQRVIDVDFPILLVREFTSSVIGDITDGTATTTGFIQTYFGYGNVFMQTSGVKQNIEFLSIPYPIDVVTVINNLKETADGS